MTKIRVPEPTKLEVYYNDGSKEVLTGDDAKHFMMLCHLGTWTMFMRGDKAPIFEWEIKDQ